jgi:hypothetical protein
VVVESCLEILPALDYLEPFRELQQTAAQAGVAEVLRKDVLSGLLQAVQATTQSAVLTSLPNTGSGRSQSAFVPSNGASSAAATAARPVEQSNSSGQCSNRFPWLATSPHTTSDGGNSSALYLEAGVGWDNIQDGKCKLDGRAENEASSAPVVIECAKVRCC